MVVPFEQPSDVELPEWTFTKVSRAHAHTHTLTDTVAVSVCVLDLGT